VNKQEMCVFCENSILIHKVCHILCPRHKIMVRALYNKNGLTLCLNKVKSVCVNLEEK